MKVDRRSFLSLGIGAAAGTALSPLPWKITDDLSIWTQNWPWTPVPPKGKTTYTNSVCTLCPGGCGISVRKIDNRVVKIEGMKEHPVNRGGICILGLSAPQLLYSPVRVPGPLQKINGTWRKISWNKAIAFAAGKIKELREQGKAHTLACIAGSDKGSVPALFRRFLDVVGSPNFMTRLSALDSYSLAQKKMQGDNGFAGFDFERSDYILSFGSGILDGWGSPVRMFKANSDRKKKRCRLIQLEPRLSNTAAKSDKWIPVKPGTEGQLALSICNVILHEQLYNRYFVENFTSGFENWKHDVLQNYQPDRVASITGVDADTIKKLGGQFARAIRPIAVCGRGKGHTPVSFFEASAIHSLNALVGNINRPGGVWSVPFPAYENWPASNLDSIARQGQSMERMDGAGTSAYPDTKYLINRLAQKINSGDGEGINILLISDANPLYTLNETGAVNKAFHKIPLKISFSTYMDETSEAADLILPSPHFLERFEDVPVAAGLTKPVLGLSRPVSKPQRDTRHSGDVIISMAKAIGGSIAASFPWPDYKTCLEDALGKIRLGSLIDKGFVEDISFTPKPWSQGFDTDSGKFEFPEPGKIKQASNLQNGNLNKFPLVLIPADSMRMTSDYIGSAPFMIKTVSDTVLKDKDSFVEINPMTAAKYGLTEGCFAMIKTVTGMAKIRVHLFEGIMPGLVAMERGLGHTGYDKYLAGKGVNVNELIGQVEDPASGLDTAWGIMADLTKV